MSSLHPLQQLKMLEEEPEIRANHTGVTRWMIPYADFLTLLLGFFVILYALTGSENQQLKKEVADGQNAMALEQTDLYHPDSLETPDTDKPNPPTDSLQSLENNLLQELKLEGHSVTVAQDTRGVVLSFQEKIFFERGKATLSEEARETLDKLATILQKVYQPIRVEGHTDNTPIQTAQFPSNWELSTARAITILKYLIEQHDFSPQQLSAAGFGEFHPIADNSTIEGKQKNRRVDIVLLNPLPEPELSRHEVSFFPSDAPIKE